MILYLKGIKKYNRSKLKLHNSISKSRTFNFDLSYFCYPFRPYSIYLIGKLSDMVKIRKRDKLWQYTQETMLILTLDSVISSLGKDV